MESIPNLFPQLFDKAVHIGIIVGISYVALLIIHFLIAR
jgi:hypothetical protein